MEHWENSTWSIESISLQLMDPDCKPIYARAYTVPRSVEQQLQQSKEIVRLVDIRFLEEYYSSEEFNMEPISLKVMDPNCIPIHCPRCFSKCCVKACPRYGIR
jgi:hypothetical protein